MSTVLKFLAPLGNLPEKQRAYVYRVLSAVVLLAVAYGVVSGDEAALWLVLAAAVLGLPAAAVNTSTKGDS